MTFEALNTEINDLFLRLVPKPVKINLLRKHLLDRYFAAHVVVLAHFAILSLKHYLQESFHGANVKSKEFKLSLEHLDNMRKHFIEFGLSFCY